MLDDRDSFTQYGSKAVVTPLEDGDLLITGYAAVWEGLDRQDENFAPGAFREAIDAFLKGQAALCYHHSHDKLMGRVLDLREDEKGLKMTARVDYQPESSPLRSIYNAVRKGSLNALSVAGFFKRALTDAGRKIVAMDFSEISMTPVPVHPGTHFSVVTPPSTADLTELRRVVTEAKALSDALRVEQADRDEAASLLRGLRRDLNWQARLTRRAQADQLRRQYGL